jgi:hypothetical protein
MGLTTKQELFSKLVALDGLSASEAYRQIYDSNPSNQSSIHEQSSKLMSNSKVSTRIKELSEAVTSRLVWDKAKIMEQLGFNVEASRNVNQFAASNRSLELLGKAVGSVFEPDSVAVTGSVSVIHGLSNEVLDQLASMVQAPEPDAIVSDSMAIEAESYQILEPEPE